MVKISISVIYLPSPSSNGIGPIETFEYSYNFPVGHEWKLLPSQVDKVFPAWVYWQCLHADEFWLNDSEFPPAYIDASLEDSHIGQTSRNGNHGSINDVISFAVHMYAVMIMWPVDGAQQLFNLNEVMDKCMKRNEKKLSQFNELNHEGVKNSNEHVILSDRQSPTGLQIATISRSSSTLHDKY